MARILIVKAPGGSREQLAGLLGGQGYEVLLAPGAEEGVAAALGERLDVVVADLLADGDAALGFLERVRAKRPAAVLPILLLVGPEHGHRLPETFEAGATDALQKPFDLTDLLVRIQVALDEPVEPRHLQVRRSGAAPPRLETGAVLGGGKYRILEVLGPGGMGQVFRVRHVGLGVDGVLKSFDAATASDPGARHRFVREVKIALELAHPALVRVLDATLSEEFPHYVTEWLPGGNLRDALRAGGPLEEDRILSLGIRVSAALAFMHDKGYVHRDVKPENVLFAGDGTARLADFGLVYPVREGRMTQVGFLVGTPGFIAPENLTSHRPPKPSGDIFSLGATLYAAATGRDAYAAADESPSGMAMALLEEPTPVRTANPKVSKALSEVVQNMLTRDPDRRFRRMSDVHGRLLGLRMGS